MAGSVCEQVGNAPQLIESKNDQEQLGAATERGTTVGDQRRTGACRGTETPPPFWKPAQDSRGRIDWGPEEWTLFRPHFLLFSRRDYAANSPRGRGG